MNKVMLRNWHDLLNVWSVNSGLIDLTFDDVCKQYSSTGRFYHTLDHIQTVLEIVERLGWCAPNPNAVKLAAWLHDVNYDSRASNNEERSAEYAERLCKKLSIEDSIHVGSLILKTKTHDPGEDSDAQVLLDADLAILGANEPAYRTYADQIRREYAWVPEPKYRNGRRQILEKFLARPRIYHRLFELEEPARRNITGEIAHLLST